MVSAGSLYCAGGHKDAFAFVQELVKEQVPFLTFLVIEISENGKNMLCDAEACWIYCR